MQALASSYAGLRLVVRLNGDLLMVVLAIALGLTAGAGLVSLLPAQP